MKKPLVLIVEDDDWMAEHNEKIVRSAGYRVAVSRNAHEAITDIDECCPDIVVLDIMLAGSNAFTLMHELQSYCDTGSIPIIICTSLAIDLGKHDLKSYGVRKILDKTVMKPDDLVSAIRSVL